MAEPSEQRPLLARALAALEDAERRLAAACAALTAPVAILGWACRLPGGICTPEALWRFVEAGGDAIGPPSRAGLEAVGGYLDDPFAFDAEAFGMSTREAALIDPQQRLALTVAREALEDAQLVPVARSPGATGVYVAASTLDFALTLLTRGHHPDARRALAIGASHAAIAGHVSRHFGLDGPSFSADAACASGLVALDAAVGALRRREVERALVIGVNVILEPHLGQAFFDSGLASADGRCRAFSADAAGYGRGEAAVALVLARAEAPSARRRERARILGSKVLHGGASVQLGAPSGPAEEAVIRGALADAQLDAARVRFVEAHATATPIGDVVELEALGQVYGAAARAAGQRVAVASAKTHFGHTEAASGLVGVLQAGLQVAAGRIAPHLHFERPSPHVDLAGLGLRVPVVAEALEVGAIGGVSAFGFTGTNAHVIVGPATKPEQAARDEGRPRPALLLLSAPSTAHLRALAATLADAPAASVDWGAFTGALAVGRPALSVRAALVASSAAEAAPILRRFARGEEPTELARGVASALCAPVDAQAELPAMARAWVSGAALPLERLWPSARWVELPLSPALERTIGLELLGEARPVRGVVARERVAAEGPARRAEGAAPRLARSAREDDLVRRVAALLGGVEPDLDAPLRDLGLDSRHALALRADLERDLAVALPATLVLEHPTLARLAEALDRRVAGEAAPAAPARRPVGLQVPVAIVGLGCRMPGEADDPEALWALLATGRDAVVPIPEERWSRARYATPDAALVRDVFGFDAAFFGVAPREAAAMDPQQRLLLECAWTALEDALIPPSSLAGSAAGVFVGISSSDYALRPHEGLALDGFTATGNAHSIAANRLSYTLDLRGPSLAVDTACSSSLVALHLACQSLAAGECEVALAGGVNVILAPEPSVAFARAGMLAPDGRSKTFDARADGYGRGEGAGMVVLKRLDDAQRDGDRIWAVVRGSAVVQDGRTQGLTAPSLEAQVEVIERALARAGISGDAIDVVETHGTGTPLGDPIEVEALARALGPAGPPVALGAVKTNLGHLEAAAGIAGTLKVVLSLVHAQLPPNLHHRETNPHLRMEARRFRLPGALEAWPRGERPRRAGQSAFGFGGTNAHVVLEEGPLPAAPQLPAVAIDPPLLLSARDPAALRALAARTAEVLGRDPGGLGALAADAAHGRDHHRHRAAIVAGDPELARAALGALASGTPAPGLWVGQAARRGPGRVAFVCPGQGTAGLEAALGRAERSAAFARALARCEALLSPRFSLRARLASGAEDTATLQPALVAVAWSSAEALRAHGVEPDAAIGHSVGELAALAIAGALSIEDALELAAQRGAAMQALPAGGAMGLVMDDRVLPPEVCVAAFNAPGLVAIAGPRAAVEAIADRLLPVGHAFHSPLVEPALAAIDAAAAQVTLRAPRVPVVEGATGQLRRAAPEALAFSRGARAPVHFQQGLEALRADGITTFVDLGPSGAMAELARRTLPDAVVVSAEDAPAALHVAGRAVVWSGRRAGSSLPTYPFQRQRHVLEPTPRAAAVPARLSFVDQGDE